MCWYPLPIASRSATARLCVTKLCINIPAVIDDMHDTTEAAYTGWPDRLYVIDREGRMANKGAPGPYGFIPKAVEKTLQRLVPSLAQKVSLGHVIPAEAGIASVVSNN